MVLLCARSFGYWASIDVFVVTTIVLVFIMPGLAAYLVDLVVVGTCNAAQDLLSSILSPGNGECVDATLTPDWGFYIALFAMLAQVSLGLAMNRINGIVIRDRDDVIERSPHQMWTWSEYFVLYFCFEYGVEHHRPVHRPNFFERIFVGFAQDPKQAVKKQASGTCSMICCCFQGIDTVSIPVAQAGGGSSSVPPPSQKPSKWNTPSDRLAVSQQSQLQHPHHHVDENKWNAPKPAPPPGLGFSQTQKKRSGGKSVGQQSQSIAVESGETRTSENPIFRREKTFSVDV